MRSRQLWKKGIVLIPFLAVTLFADNQAKSQSWSPQVSITWGPGSPPYYAGGAGSGYTAEDPNTLFILSNSSLSLNEFIGQFESAVDALVHPVCF